MIEGPLYFFRDAWMGIFAWNVNEDLFFPWIVNLYFSVLGKMVLDFFVIRQMCIYFRVIFEPTTFEGTIFHFFWRFKGH